MPKRKSANPLQPSRSSRRLKNEPPKRPEEALHTTWLFRCALAAFLIHAATSVDKASYFTLRGRHQWSLSLHLLMSCKEYSALLLGCEFVIVKWNTEEARKEVKVNWDNLDHFMKWYINKGSDLQRQGPVEVSHDNTIYKDVMRYGERLDDRTNVDSMRMTLVRIGAYDSSLMPHYKLIMQRNFPYLTIVFVRDIVV